MKRTANLFLAALMLGSAAFAVQAYAANQPCEDALKEYRAAKATANLSADVMKKADELEAKAVERCNADDDKRADQFVGDAMKLLGK
ncbi:hypothetical protein ASE04_20700 [Rhizobium sp. Root708]|uniref:hypothetical protein n=1 Tax=Rhizobium sp. Root708 TaxID=1736592 RepID=UPI0006FDBDBC|nr:hypothetical protein [Rhizobium sp. Root708]KRB61928.1 hypothetical protein ASE04_20700 [Rhizobium sp. Root708]